MMNRFPKIFPMARHSSDFAPDSSSSSKTKRRHRHRINGLKNADSSSTCSASRPSCSDQESPGAGLVNSSRSFRVYGNEEELDVLCKTLGFSDISEFSIAPDEYEELKSTPSLLHDVFHKVQFPDGKQLEDDSLDFMGVSSHVESTRVLDVIHHTGEVIYDNRFEDRIMSGDNGACPSVGCLADEIVLSGKSKARANDIIGVRPRELVRPPYRTTILADEHFANWDAGVSRFFAKENEDVIEDDDISRRIMVNEDNSCSFTTTSADDDTSSTTTEHMSNISPSGKYELVIGDWQKGDLIGNGSVGSVYEGYADCGLIFAVKQVSLLDQGGEGKERIVQLQKEIDLLSHLEHKNIVRYYGTRKDDYNLYIFLELVPKGSLLSLYMKYDLRVSQVANYTKQILRGLKYLHDRNIIHRDIKCANILVETNRSVKLADFGLAKVIQMTDVISCKGTAFWMAPEVVRGQGYGLSADIWSLGCTVLEMLTRSFPYSNMERMAAVYKIGSGERPPIPNTIVGDARDMILQCLQIDPARRPTAAQLLNHPFLKRSPCAPQ